MKFSKTFLLIMIALIMLVPAVVFGALFGIGYFLDIWVGTLWDDVLGSL